MKNNSLSSNTSLFLLLGTVILMTSCSQGARLPTQILLDEAAILEEALEESAVGKRSESAEAGSLWFGPRLGRRRRSPPEETQLLIEAEDGAIRGAEALAEILRDAPWALVALKEYPGGKRQTLTFTPRLGRELDSSEEIRSPPFSPRLGRGNGLPFSPRLGRQQELHNTRIGRSAPDPRPVSNSSEHH